MTSSNNLNGKSMNPVIDFDFILNTEIGLIRFIRNNFQDDRAFKLDILNKSDREILSLLYSRQDWNPLSIITTEENRNDIDELYKSFLDNYKQEIIKLSIFEKSIKNFIRIMISSGFNFGVFPAISVADNIESNSIYEKFGRCNIITKDNNFAKVVAMKDAYYVKDYKFFLDNNLNIVHKIIYTTNRFYNLEYFKNTDSKLTRTNEIKLAGKNFASTENEPLKQGE